MSAVDDAIEALRQAMLDEGQDPGTVEAKLHMAKPMEVNVVGNIADMMRAGESTTTVVDDGEAAEDEVDTDSMSKAELQAELDARGIDYPASANKAELQALLG